MPVFFNTQQERPQGTNLKKYIYADIFSHCRVRQMSQKNL